MAYAARSVARYAVTEVPSIREGLIDITIGCSGTANGGLHSVSFSNFFILAFDEIKRIKREKKPKKRSEIPKREKNWN